MLSNDNGTQVQELGDERASILLELNAVADAAKKLGEVGSLLFDARKSMDSIAFQDDDIHKRRELLEEIEKICKDVFPLEQEYVRKKQELFCDLVFGQLDDEPHDGKQ